MNTIADLEGRTVGMATLGGSMEGTLDLMMTNAGASPEKVNKVKVADSAASFALIEAGRLQPEKMIGSRITLEKSIDVLTGMDASTATGIPVITSF